MKSKIRLISFALTLLPAFAFADSVSITFDTALTNETKWIYSDKILISQDHGEHIYFDSLDSSIQSPEYLFNITSVVIRLHCSSTTPTRYLKLKSNEVIHQFSAVAKKDTIEEQTFNFNASDAVRTLTFTLEGEKSTGNWHLYSADIFGAPIVATPSSLNTTDTTGTRFTLSWINHDSAASNSITISQITDTPMSMTVLDDYNFIAFTNTDTNAQNILDDNQQMLNYTSFSGINVYKAGNSIGELQISSGKNRGILAYDTQTLFDDEKDSIENLSLLITAKKHSTDTSGEWRLSVAVSTDSNTTTNEINTLDIDYEFPPTPDVIPLPEIHKGDVILISPSGTRKTNCRILIDDIAFVRDYSPAYSTTNIISVVSATESPITIRGLEPDSHYVVYVTAFDGEGNESAPSESIEVWTNDKNVPFSVSIR